MMSVKDLAYAAITRLPARVTDRVLPGQRRLFREAGLTSAPEAARRLLIAPANSAGQAHAWAKAARTLPGTGAVNMMPRGDDDVFGFPADHVVPALCYVANARWSSAERSAVSRRFTHVIAESGRPLFRAGGDLLADIEHLRSEGVRVALLWHGSDIRLPSSHAAREPDSPFRDARYPETGLLEEIAQRNHRLVADSGLPVFVSTPDLLVDLPSATWLPVVVDVETWARAGARAPRLGGRPVVVHAPSRAGLKGSDAIADVVARLHDDGVIEYREVRGIPSDRMPEFYGSADIVLDQFSLGIYGVAACEALAAGRLVVSHVAEVTRETVRARTGHELPVVQARANELEAVLRQVVATPTEFARHAAAGPAFVRAVHDGRQSAAVLSSFLAGRSA